MINNMRYYHLEKEIKIYMTADRYLARDQIAVNIQLLATLTESQQC